MKRVRSNAGNNDKISLRRRLEYNFSVDPHSGARSAAWHRIERFTQKETLLYDAVEQDHSQEGSHHTNASNQ